jgi:chromosome partitioning protein
MFKKQRGLPMRVIAWCSEKGGTGKTSSAINSAVALAKSGRRVLLVDLDPQANASLVMLEGQPAEPPTAGTVLLGDAGALEVVRPTRTPGLDVLPADVSLADANLELANRIGRENRLRAALAEGRGVYDLVVIDTPPTRSLLTINALVAATEVLIPVEPSLFSLSGLGQLQSAVDDVRRYLDNPGLRIAGILLTRTRHDSVSRDIEVHLRETFGGLVFTTTIPTNVKVEESHGRFQSVIDYAPRSPGARAYLALAAEILDGGTKERTGTTPDRAPETDHRKGGRRAG